MNIHELATIDHASIFLTFAFSICALIALGAIVFPNGRPKI